MSLATQLQGLLCRLRCGTAVALPSRADVLRLDSLGEEELAARTLVLCREGEGTTRLTSEARVLDVVARYEAMLGEPAVALEALKRLLFLWWITTVEPYAVTGIPDLPEHAVTAVVERLRVLQRAGGGDGELHAMLDWYWTIHADPFRRFGLRRPAPPLEGVQRAHSPFAHRGVLGCYWHDLVTAQEQAHTSSDQSPQSTRS